MLTRRLSSILKPMRLLLLAGAAAVSLSACATSPTTTGSVRAPDFAGQTMDQRQQALAQLGAHYKKDPGNKTTIIYYSAALRANGQAEQAIAVLEGGLKRHKSDQDLLVAYAKALSVAGRFEQAMNIVEMAIDPTAPDWNALLVKGAILDQVGKNQEARAAYRQGLKIAPGQASLHANLGLSYAMTSELDKAEAELRLAVTSRGATSQVRQNLALVIGLQGRFEESQAMFAAEMPAAQVEANMAYIRALLTQQNRWDLIKGSG